MRPVDPCRRRPFSTPPRHKCRVHFGTPITKHPPQRNRSPENPRARPSFPCAWAFGDRRWRGRRQVAIGPPGLFGLVRRDDLGARGTVVSQNLDARLLPDSVAIRRLSWCCSPRTIGDLRLISDEIVARLAYERALFQPWPYLGQERCRRCRGRLRCLLLVILPAAVTAADLCMGRGHCAEEEQQRHRKPTPRETRPCGVAWWPARLNVIHPYRLTSFAPGLSPRSLARPTR